MKFEFSQQIFETTQTSNFMEIRPVVSELFHADGKTHTKKLTVTFRNSLNATNNKPEGNAQSH
jgi:hypothetical protein